MTEATVLPDLLVTEHAAVYAYGVLGARLDEPTRRLALSAYAGHRASRDDLVSRLTQRGLEAPGPELSYAVTTPGRSQALALAVRVETELAVRWRDLVAVTDDPALRRLAVQRLSDCAVRAVQWRAAAKDPVVSVALPGEA